MTREPLKDLPGVILGAPADEVALAVADALLPAPLPPALRAFLTICDGAQAGGVEVFSAERITETTNQGAHTWHLPDDTLVIGTAGPGRALIMIAGRDEVDEVDDDPWDVRTIDLSAGTPLDLFVRHRGIPLRDRAAWSTMPGLSAALDAIRTSLAGDVEALLDTGIGSRVGEPLPSSLHGFRRVDAASGTRLLTSHDYEMFLVNYRPDAPAPGPSAQREWERACEAIVSAALLDRIRAAPVSAMIESIGSVNDDDLTAAQTVRSLAFLALLGKARDDMSALVRGDDDDDKRPGPSPGQRLAQVFLAGHVPVSPDAAI